MGGLRIVKQGLDKALEVLVAMVMGLLVLDVTWQVVFRFVVVRIRPNATCTWTEELATFLLVWVALLGASVALHRKAHLGIDYFVSKLEPHTRKMAELFSYLCVVAFSLGVMTVGGTILVMRTFELGQISPALHLEMGYVYLAVPMSGFFMTLYSLEGIVQAAIGRSDMPVAEDVEAGSPQG